MKGKIIHCELPLHHLRFLELALYPVVFTLYQNVYNSFLFQNGWPPVLVHIYIYFFIHHAGEEGELGTCNMDGNASIKVGKV